MRVPCSTLHNGRLFHGPLQVERGLLEKTFEDSLIGASGVVAAIHVILGGSIDLTEALQPNKPVVSFRIYSQYLGSILGYCFTPPERQVTQSLAWTATSSRPSRTFA